LAETFENILVPTIDLEDGRLFITDLEVARQPWVAEFVGRFSNYWQRDPYLCGWVSPLPDPPSALTAPAQESSNG
jgi:hypothetical protein